MVEKLRPREIAVLNGAAWAYQTGYGGGNFLPSPRDQPSARRLIERGLLTECSPIIGPGIRWTVVRIEPINIERIKFADAATFDAPTTED